MTISQNSEYALSHPFLKMAATEFLNGNKKELKTLLDTLQEDMYHKVLAQCVKSYKRFKNENYPIIEEAIRFTAPPENLNVQLRIPMPAPECKVVVMKAKKIRSFLCTNCKQLEIEFKQA